MKKILLIVIISFLIAGCGSLKEISSSSDDTIENNDYQEKEELFFSPDSKPIDGKQYQHDDFVYIIYDDNSIEITKYISNDKEVSIYSEVNGYPVSRIGDFAFENCTTIEEIDIWADIISIGNSAFKGCTQLKEINVPNSVTLINDSTFENCTSLEEVNLWGDIVSIGNSAFKNCTSLKEISIPNECMLIKESAFENCVDIEEVNIWGGGIIESSAFKNCTSLKEISLPREITSVGEYAFANCSGLQEVNVWGDNVEFEVNVFLNCPKLKDMPEGAYNEYVEDEEKDDEDKKEEKDNIVSFVKGGTFTLYPHEFFRRFDEAYDSIKNYSYSLKTVIDDSKQFYDKDYYLLYEILDDNYKSIGLCSFTKLNGDSVIYSEEFTKDIFSSIIILIDGSDDNVVGVILGTLLAVDPSLAFNDAINIGIELAQKQEVTKNTINYMLVQDNDYIYLLVNAI